MLKKKRILVIGLGPLGTSLVEELWDANVDLVVVDMSEAAIDAVKDKTSAAYVGDGSNPQVLEGIGAKNMDVAVVAFAHDFEASVLAISSLAQLKIPHIIGRGADDRQATVLRAVGATRVLLVEREMGRRLAPEVLSPASSDLVEYAAAFRIVPWVAAGAMIGKTVADFDRHHTEVNVLGYWREQQATKTGKKPRPILPTPDYRVQKGDTLLLIGLHDAVEKFLAEGWE
jgi:trk system potassium uptake protein TrkA